MNPVASAPNVIALEDHAQRRIERALERCGFADPGYTVAVSIRNGVAHLSGSVRYEEEIAVVGALVLEMAGITGIVNRILYREPPPASAAPNGKEEGR